MAGRSKYSLIRAFTRERGITPYSYLMAARVGEAKRLLEAGTRRRKPPWRRDFPTRAI